jgi:transglycosylase-like protein with SLT domain
VSILVSAFALSLPQTGGANHHSEPCEGHSISFCESLVSHYGAKVRTLRRTLMYRSSVREAMALSSVVYRVPAAELRRVAFCESRFNRFARSAGGHLGLFQYAPSTWRSTPFAGFSPFSPLASSLATGWMWSRGRKGEWACA